MFSLLTITCWLRVLKAKYFPEGNPLGSSRSSGSQFWRQLLSVKDEFRSLVKFSVGDGRSIRFWLDWWTEEGPLFSVFPILFSYCSMPSISVAELAANNWNFGFRRMLSPVELEEWHRLYPPSCALGDSGIGVLALVCIWAVLC